jgi:hypothetical protein
MADFENRSGKHLLFHNAKTDIGSNGKKSPDGAILKTYEAKPHFFAKNQDLKPFKCGILIFSKIIRIPRLLKFCVERFGIQRFYAKNDTWTHLDKDKNCSSWLAENRRQREENRRRKS